MDFLEGNTNDINDINDLENIFYINLLERKDRNETLQNELKKIGLNEKSQRFNAIKLKKGLAGCALSHIKVLEEAIKNNLDYLMVFEDDFEVFNPSLFKENLNNFLKNVKQFDVLLLCGNNEPPFNRINNVDYCIKVKKCQTLAGYLVRNHYFETLLKNYKEGLNWLLKYPNKDRFYAIDKYNLQLQQRDNWYLLIPSTACQSNGFSNIANSNMNYRKIMVDYEKVNFLIYQELEWKRDNGLID